MKKIAFSLAFMVAVLALQLTAAAPVMADNTVTYTYTGNVFTYICPYIGSNMKNVTASVTFDSSVITSNFTGEVGNINGVLVPNGVVSWSITSGDITFTQAQNPVAQPFFVFVFQNGVITQWTGIIGNCYSQNEPGCSSNPYYIFTQNWPSSYVSDTIENETLLNDGCFFNDNSNAAGTWTLQGSLSPSPVPGLGPTAMLLLVACLAGIVVCRRKIRA
jgi:hypothetical protein